MRITFILCLCIFITSIPAEDVLKYFDTIEIETADPKTYSYVYYSGSSKKLKRHKLERYDKIVGIYGKPIRTKQEYDYVRLTEEENSYIDLELIVIRGDQVTEVKTFTDPFRSMDIKVYSRLPSLNRWLLNNNISVSNRAAYCTRYLSEKTIAKIVDWTEIEGNDRTWVKPFCELYAQFCLDSWDTITIEIEETPVMEINNLISFYKRLLDWHNSGKETLDVKNDLQCDLDFFAFHAPLPIPYFGSDQMLSGKTPDITAMLDSVLSHRSKHIQRPDLGEHRWLKELYAAYGEIDGETLWYIQRVCFALIAPESNGGWPYKYSSHQNESLKMTNPEGRQLIYDRLKKFGDTDEVKLARIVPATLTKNVEEAEGLVNELCAKSPAWLPYVFELYTNALRHYKYIPMKGNISIDFELPLDRSRLLKYLIDRSNGNNLGKYRYLLFPDYTESFYHPANIYECIRKTLPIKKRNSKIKDRLKDDLSVAEKRALAEEIVNNGLPYPSKNDLELLKTLKNSGSCNGIVLSELRRMCYRMHQSSIYHEIIPNWHRTIFDNFLYDGSTGFDSPFEVVSRGLAKLVDASDDEKLMVCDELYEKHGTFSVAFLIGNYISENNLDVDAYKGLGINSCDWLAFYVYVSDSYRPTYYKRALAFSYMMPYLNIRQSPSIHRTAASIYERQLKGSKKGGLLNASYGYYLSGKIKESAKTYIKAMAGFESEDSDKQPHFYNGKASTNSDEFAEYLLSIYEKDPRFESHLEELKQEPSELNEQESSGTDDF